MPEVILLQDVESLGTKGAVVDVSKGYLRNFLVPRKLAQLAKAVMTFARQAGEDGRLFGWVTNQDVAEAIKEARGVEVDRRKINLEEPIKHIGTYKIDLELEGGVA